MKLDWNPHPFKVLDTKQVKSTQELLRLSKKIDLSHIGTIIQPVDSSVQPLPILFMRLEMIIRQLH